jgi:CheY-like chemotaxis protein
MSKPVNTLAAAKPQAPTGTIVVVDDEDMVRTLVCTVLERVGYRVFAVDHAITALENLPHETIAVVTDVRMPGMSGPELAEQLRLERPQLPVVYMSGYAGEPAFTKLVKKPFTSLLELVTAVQSVLAAVSEAETQLDVPALGVLTPPPRAIPADASAR